MFSIYSICKGLINLLICLHPRPPFTPTTQIRAAAQTSPSESELKEQCAAVPGKHWNINESESNFEGAHHIYRGTSSTGSIMLHLQQPRTDTPPPSGWSLLPLLFFCHSFRCLPCSNCLLSNRGDMFSSVHRRMFCSHHFTQWHHDVSPAVISSVYCRQSQQIQFLEDGCETQRAVCASRWCYRLRHNPELCSSSQGN